MANHCQSRLLSFLGLIVISCTLVVSGCASLKTNDSASSLPSVYVVASGVGATQDTALNEAFRDAIQKSVGVLIRSEITLDQGKITTDLIHEYSAGFINSYEVINQSRDTNGLIKIKIGALVSSTKLLSKFKSLAVSGLAQNIAGNQVYAKLRTLNASLEQADSLLIYAASGYPARAIKAKLGEPKLVVDENRKSVLMVPFEISWVDDYIESLEEAIKYVSSGKCFLFAGFGQHCKFDVKIGSVWGYRLADARQTLILSSNFQPDLGLSIKLLDHNENLINAFCMPIDVNPGHGDYFFKNNVGRRLLEWRYGALNIYPTTMSSSLKLEIQRPEDIKNLKRITADITKSCS